MATLPPNYLAKQGGRWRPVRLLDLVTLLRNVHVGAASTEVGFEDARESLDSLTRKLNKKIYVEPAILESCLWSCNLLDERGEFWDIKGRSLDELIRQLMPDAKFDSYYNLILNKDGSYD